MNKIDMMIFYALQFVGKPYVWGGDDPITGYDCSGVIQEILSSVGLDPKGDQTAQALFEYFSKNGTFVVPDQYQAGCLVFYGKDEKNITHVSMMLNDFQIIEAGGGTSKTVDEKSAARDNAFVRIRPITSRNDKVAVILPRMG